MPGRGTKNEACGGGGTPFVPAANAVKRQIPRRFGDSGPKYRRAVPARRTRQVPLVGFGDPSVPRDIDCATSVSCDAAVLVRHCRDGRRAFTLTSAIAAPAA